MTQDGLAALKGRRNKRPGVTATAPNPAAPPDRPGASVPQAQERVMPFLLDPAEMPAVIESSGAVPPADNERFYRVAEHACYEQFVPPGCRTPVSRMLWNAGMLVRRDVYAAFERDRLAAPESAVPVIETTGGD
jgi:hypothetical protein